MPWLLEMTTLVSVLMIPPVLYLSWRMYAATKQLLSRSAWGSLLIPLLLLSFYFFPAAGLLDFYFSGEIDVLTYPKPLTYWFWFGLVFVFQLAGWVIAADITKLASRLLSWDPEVVDRWHARLLIVLFVVVFAGMGWKTYSDTNRIVTDHIDLRVDELPESLEGFKLVHISDIQGDEYTGEEEISRYIAEVNRQNADLIVFTGDLISYGTDFIESSARAFGKAKARFGTVAVVGDHDYWAGTGNVERALREQGIPLVRDDNHVIAIDSSTSAVVTGITQVYSKNSDPAIVDSLASSTGDAALKIFASHQLKPHLISSSQENSYDIMLAGHTHGGQIHVPFLGMGFSASERETKYVSGLYRENGMPIHVNNGLGFTLGPIRYNAPPEVTVIRLRGK